jgi:hypothetical protein
MPRKKINHNNLSKFMDKKSSLEDLPLKTLRITIYALKWVFLLIFLYILIGILALLVTGGTENVQMIVTYSITGFFTFFMGYFGWLLAQGMIEMITGNKEKMERGLSYYLKKHKKHRF